MPARRATTAVTRAGRAAVAIACTLACASDASIFLLDAFAPAQRRIFEALMPDFEIRSFRVEQRGAHLQLLARSVTSHYISVAGRAFAPGIDIDVETPARAPLVHAALIVGGAALLVRPDARALGIAALLVAVGAATMMIVAPAIQLAGAQWGLVVSGFSEPTLASLLVGASGFLAHGGAYALCAAAIALALAAGEHAQRGRAR